MGGERASTHQKLGTANKREGGYTRHAVGEDMRGRWRGARRGTKGSAAAEDIGRRNEGSAEEGTAGEAEAVTNLRNGMERD